MDVGTLLSVAQTFFAVLQSSPQLDDMFSILRYKSELDNLKCTLDTISAALDDAETMQDQGALSSQARLYVDQLKDVVYDADDLFDELRTLDELRKLKQEGANILSQKLRLLFSSCNTLGVASTISKRAKEITNKFNVIAHNHSHLSSMLFNSNFKLGYQPTNKRRDTCSYENAHDIIGREEDVENIVGRLLDPSVQKDVSCLAIVGIGGLGKTTIAQLVYNDPRINKEFPLRLWICVADENQKELDVKATLCKILNVITDGNYKDLALEKLQEQVREQLARDKFLLVLDDMWNEHCLQWLELEKFLKDGPRGSRILVTTRSENTATAVGDNQPYKLKGLSDEASWNLFKIMAFGQTDEQPCSPDMEEIGRGIVKRCANIPLAIRVVGSLLNGHGKDKWLSFQEIALGRLKIGTHGGIEPILKLSYRQLESPLKKCFKYCAIFPKDHVIEKEMLISLWMAQDYIVPLQEGQSIEDAGEEYFVTLVKRCFFQDVAMDEYGSIVSCKIHDLMHDIAQEVAGKEVHTTKSTTAVLENKIRHLSHVYESGGVSIEKCYVNAKIRTYIHFGWRNVSAGKVLSNWMCLRTLDLRWSRRKSLPSAIGKLVHLRYLDLSENHRLKRLPKTITNLINLQTLCLGRCIKLKRLPRDFPNLVELRVLDIAGCHNLTWMPLGIGKLACLQKLSMFVVGGQNSRTKHNVFDEMEDLKHLKNLKGRLNIRIATNFEDAQGYSSRGGGYMKNKKHLNCVHIQFSGGGRWDAECYEHGLLLEDLEPHHNLKELKLSDYLGRRIPSWTEEYEWATVVPNLVHLCLHGCKWLQQLPSLRKLRHLKSFTLLGMPELEYIENTTSKSIISTNNNAGAVACGSETFFPSLYQLVLNDLPKLKGWWRDNDEMINTNGRQEAHLLPSFPCLSELSIIECLELTSVPSCPTVEELELYGICSKVRIMNAIEPGSSKLRKACTDNAEHLKSAFPMDAFRCLSQMEIVGDGRIESLSEVEEVLHSCSSSLRRLKISNCGNLKSVGRGGSEHLTVLEELTLSRLPNLNLGNNAEEDVFPHSLVSLTLWDLPKMVNIPKGITNLTALQSLKIKECRGLKSMPESMRQLTSLTTLEIRRCSDGLLKRCQYDTGEDWPNIQHIPNLRIMK